ncbi:MAG: beta-CASP ribonuclease aCPSF1 [Candidatus Diapherotrites archaeon]|nr:beta-CASP ribonuclease aCPSF1 [Candidatus Diapherotrites archaeon]
MSEEFSEIEDTIKATVPPEALVTKTLMQASEVIVFTKNIAMFLEDEMIVKNLATALKKRVHIRSDQSMVEDPGTAEKRIRELVPENAGTGDIGFNPDLSEVVIEAKKPGVVIGKQGSTLKEIAIKTGWYPQILRLPTSPSNVVKGIRHNLLKHAGERVKIMKNVSKRIYREGKSTDWVRLTPLGGSREVGRSSFLLETPSSKVILDCGINVANNSDAYPMFGSLNFPLDEIDAVVVSHAHLDHSGFVPYLYKYGYDGPVYSTAPTRDVMVLLQLDYIDVTVKEGRDPPYTQKDIEKMIKYSITRNYGEVTDIAPDIRLTFHNAGHIIGSACAHLHIGRGVHNLLYTGDFKFGYTRLFNTVHTAYPRVETLIMESTYGGPRDVQPPRYMSEKLLVKAIKETTEAGGTVLIPVFAVGRAQEIMLVLEEHSKKENWDIPVYIDGMTREASAIHTVYPEFMRRNIKKRVLHNNSPFDSDMFIVVDKTKRGEIMEEKGSVILSPSGMLTGGPSVEYFKSLCEDPKNTIIFVGYQGEGTLGKKVQLMGMRKNHKKIPLQVGGKTIEFDVKMRIETIEGFSGHSDRNQLLGFYKRLQPKPERVITVHGDEKNCMNLARTLSYNYKVEATAPRNLDSIRLK